MKRSDFLSLSAMVAVAPVPTGGSLPSSVAGVAIPGSSLAQEALNIARAAEDAALLGHSLRTFLFAELLAKAKGISHNAELVFVASLMHDLGLTQGYMSSTNRFEVDGANSARQLMEKHQAPESAIEIVWDAIALHDSGGIARWKRAEVRLVNAGVGADFGGSLEALSREDVIAVLRFAPRDGFIGAFLPAVAAVAAKKPFATGNCFVTDVGYRLVPGFHLSNFCDDVKDDPFDKYS